MSHHYLLNPRKTWPKVPLPKSFPFFHLDRVFSTAPLALELGKVDGLVGEPGGRGSRWHWDFPSVGDSILTPDNRAWRGEVGLVGPLDPGPGLLGIKLNLPSPWTLGSPHNLYHNQATVPLYNQSDLNLSCFTNKKLKQLSKCLNYPNYIELQRCLQTEISNC